MKILFITRTYPPLVGGMETFASGFYENYRNRGEIHLLANPGGKKTILFFFIKVFFLLIFHARNYDVIHIYDAVLSPFALIIKIFSTTSVSFTVNGLDIVYTRFGYQKIILPFLKMADRVFAISQYTMEQCQLRGIPKEKLRVIPVGIHIDNVQVSCEPEKSEIRSKFNIPAKDVKILLTVGRLVKRKGHAWFIAHVLKELPDHYRYLIAGAGAELDTIKNLVDELNLTDRVYLLGRVSDQEKNCLYQIADLFVMPNITVENDQEGFGIVLLEAGQYGLPIIASDIEGIKDVVIPEKTGYLIEEKNAQQFIHAITSANIERSSLINIVASHFGWEHVIEMYSKEFEQISR